MFTRTWRNTANRFLDFDLWRFALRVSISNLRTFASTRLAAHRLSHFVNGQVISINRQIEGSMLQNSDNQIALFIRHEKTGRHAFNPKALKALGVDPVIARELGYPVKDSEELESNLAA
jgi:hypothetical protein